MKAGLHREKVKQQKMPLDKTHDDKYYKGADSNSDKYAKKGSFKHNSRTKPAPSPATRKQMANDAVTARISKIARGMFATRQGDPMHAQPNA